jgi:hypothetical protein
MRRTRLECIENFGVKGDKIILQKIKTLEGCYSPIKKLWGLKRKFILYTFISHGHPIIVYKKTYILKWKYPFLYIRNLKNFKCTDVHKIEKIEDLVYRVTTCTSIYIINLKK